MATRKRPQNKVISMMDHPAYAPYGAGGPSAEMSRASLEVNEPIQRSSAYFDFNHIAGNGKVSVREGMTRDDYDWFRPTEHNPRWAKEAMIACMYMYRHNGILKNVIDMMSSFGCQGIEIIHPVKSRQKAYRHWFQKVRGPEVSQRFLNLLYRAGNVFIKRGIAKLKAADIKDLQRGFASLNPDEDYERSPKPLRNEIPIKYTFLNPIHVELVHGELASFLGHQVYMLRIPTFLMTLIRTPNSPTEEQLVKDLPDFIRKPIQQGQRYILLDNDKMSVYHYMKDDWEQWAHPMASAIFSDLKLYEKMKLADMAALDGAISKIRLWKLGSLEHQIQAGPAAFQKLHDMLLAQTGGGSMDLIWDAAIELDETSTDIAKFLGEAKYQPVLRAIFAGLGIPQSLSGGNEQGASFSNNAISLKTMIERLQYGRTLLTHFWQAELRALQEAFGDKQPARVIYDNMQLYDEAAEKMVWVQLYDRDLVSIETIQERFGMIPEVELLRQKRETQGRDSGKVNPKAGPFHNAQSKDDMTKIALQQGTIAPTEAGVEKKPKQKGDKSLMDHQNRLEDQRFELEKQSHEQDQGFNEELHKQKLQQNDDIHNQKLKQQDTEHKTMLPVKKQALKQKLKGQPQQGRPKNSGDKTKRKQKRVLPKSKAMAMFDIERWTRNAQKTIAEILTPIFLQKCNKKNVRSLTVAQAKELEDRKFDILWNTAPFTKVDAEYVETIHATPLPEATEGRNEVAGLIDHYELEPTIDDIRELQVSAYILHKGEVTDGETND